jgi:hypothetical protein
LGVIPKLVRCCQGLSLWWFPCETASPMDRQFRMNPKEAGMKRVYALLSASGLVLALSLPSWAQEVKQLPTQTVTLSGTVATIDHAKRVVNIKTARHPCRER